MHTHVYTYIYIYIHTHVCSVRVIIANDLASNAKEWVEIFSLYNSGTYNNQWGVIDMKVRVYMDA
jgi:hypothetical protein